MLTFNQYNLYLNCLLYTSDAADDLLCVDLGGRRIINKKTKIKWCQYEVTQHQTKIAREGHKWIPQLDAV